MATITTETSADQCVVMRGVDWNGYEAVLRARGEKAVPRIVYLDGELFLISPSFAHEHLSGRLGQFVMVVVEELDIPYVPARSTTFRRRQKRGGVEGDETFYLANASRIVGTGDLHLRKDPPPDLAVEAVNTHEADAAVEVWRRFGVPEVWVCDGAALRILSLQPDGRYSESPASVSFPFLSSTEIFDWVSRPQTGNETSWIKLVRGWVRDVLVPRAKGDA